MAGFRVSNLLSALKNPSPLVVVLGVAIAVAAFRTNLAPGGQNVGSTPTTASRPSGSVELNLQSPRIVVLKSKRRLHLLDGDRLVRTFPIELGKEPLGDKIRRDDGRTPIGRFRVVSKNQASPYHRFLGIDYPNEDAVRRGLAQGLISEGEAAAIRTALAQGARPNWNTELGGGIGLHGQGHAFAAEGHRPGARDWTAGCIALSDPHIEQLFEVLRVGDPVDILP